MWKWLSVVIVLGWSVVVRAGGLPSMAQPAVSPDGKEVAFVSGGAIWAVGTGGGDAHPLVSGIGEVGRPIYSPDGKWLAFYSTITGNGDIYLMSLDDGHLTRLTYSDSSDRLDGWSADGRWIYFTTTGHNAGAGASDIYRVSVDGGTPMAVVAEPYQIRSQAAAHRDGHTVALVAGGMAMSQWWRNGHAHIDETEIWTTDAGAKPVYKKWVGGGAKSLWPQWSSDGKTLFYTSDADGHENLYSVAEGHKPVRLTEFTDGRVLYPSVAANGSAVVFERNFEIWSYDVVSDEARRIPIKLRGVTANTPVEHQTISRGISELAISHDGRKMAFVARGQVYAAAIVQPAAGGPTPPALRITKSDAIEARVSWANDDRRIVYCSTRDGPRHIYLYDFVTKRETRLTGTDGDDYRPAFSPDDSSVAFIRNGSELRSIDMSTYRLRASRDALLNMKVGRPLPMRLDRLVADKLAFERPPFDGEEAAFAWAPAGDWIAFVSAGAKGFRNIYMVPSEGGTPPRQVSYLPNAQSNALAWATDGTSLLFGSGQRTEDHQLARIDLTPRSPKFKDDPLTELFRDRPTRTNPDRPTRPGGDDGPAGAPTTRAAVLATSRPTTRPAKTDVVFDDIEQRLSLLPTGMDVGQVTVSPDGKFIAFVGSLGNRSNIYLLPTEVSNREATPRQITSTAGDKSFLQFAPDASGGAGGARLFYVEDGYIHAVTVPGGVVSDVPFAAEADTDFEREKSLVLDQAWRYLNDGFHDPQFHGIDWKATRDRFAPYVLGAKTPVEMRRALSLMVGELNASHLSVDGPAPGARAAGGHLGLSFDRFEYESGGRLKVSGVVPFGPGAAAKIAVGEYIVDVDGTAVDRSTNLDQLLDNKVDKDVTITVAADAKGKDKRMVRVMTTTAAAERALAYKAWVRTNRDYVAHASGGRLGYVHVADMSEAALNRLYVDLDARNENFDGVVVDVRNNSGGFVNGYAIDVFTRQNYVTIEPRGFPKIGGRAALGQRALGLPTILVTNAQTLSDGEDFTQGYQSQKLGETVGEPTAGWIIFTRGTSLLDGTSFRVPCETVRTTDGEPLEMHPRPVDHLVVREVGEAANGKDSQLDEAVRRLMEKIGR